MEGKKDKMVNFRVSESEMKEIEGEAKKLNLKTSEYLRTKVFNKQEVKTVTVTKSVYGDKYIDATNNLIVEIKRVSAAINQSNMIINKNQSSGLTEKMFTKLEKDISNCKTSYKTLEEKIYEIKKIVHNEQFVFSGIPTVPMK